MEVTNRVDFVGGGNRSPRDKKTSKKSPRLQKPQTSKAPGYKGPRRQKPQATKAPDDKIPRLQKPQTTKVPDDKRPNHSYFSLSHKNIAGKILT